MEKKEDTCSPRVSVCDDYTILARAVLRVRCNGSSANRCNESIFFYRLAGCYFFISWLAGRLVGWLAVFFIGWLAERRILFVGFWATMSN